MKKRMIATTFLLCLLAGGRMWGQVTGYGSGILSDPAWSSGVHYMDDTRAQVTSVTPVSASDGQLTLGTTIGLFAPGDMALLIQMKGSGIGTHQNVYITSLSPFKVTAISGSLYPYSTGGASDRVQLIKINEYANFSLSGGVVTCHSWDDVTGGILCMLVNGTLTINGGMFTVGGKGFTSAEAGVTYATGGTGGLAPGSVIPSALLPAPGSASFYRSTCRTLLFTNIGTAGGTGGTGNPGSGNAGSPVYYGGSTFHSQLVMGNPGYYSAGSGSGSGSGGGGYGGNGAFSACGNPGSNGVRGEDGGPGGDAGRDGRGGGAMIIKAWTVNITTINVVFSCAGESGVFGGNGSQGGAGGIGGLGGAPCCTTTVLPGGPGGNGDYGAGGAGGDGGNGGEAGYIWIAANTYTYIATSRGANFDASGGSAGKGGKGGYGWGNTTKNPVDVANCSGQYCPGGGPGNGCRQECDPDKAMCMLASNAYSANLISGDVWFLDNSAAVCAKYLAASNTLEVYDGCNVYFATWRDGTPKDPDLIFEHFASTPAFYGLISYSNRPFTVGCGSPITYPLHIDFFNGSMDTILEYDHKSQSAPAYIEETGTTTNRCYTTECPPAFGVGFVQAADGKDGEPGADGKVDMGDPKDNVYIDTPAAWRLSNPNGESITRNDLSLQATPNPTDGELQVTFNGEAETTYTLTVLDVSGRLVLQQQVIGQHGQNNYKISAGTLGKGVYFLSVTSGNRTSQMKIVVE